MEMVPQQNWPPPPDTPEPLTEHDEFLKSCVRSPTSKPPLSRLRLIRDLRKETSLDLRQCMAVVNGFCDRHAILMPLHGPCAWVGCLVPLIQIMAMVAFEVSLFFLERAHDAASTRVARLALRAERIDMDLMFLGIFVVATCFQVVFVLRRAKQARRDAAVARAKMA